MPLCHRILSKAMNTSKALAENTQRSEELKVSELLNNDGMARDYPFMLINQPSSSLINTSFFNGTFKFDGEETLGFFMVNIRLLKAIVLGIVVVILILSACKIVLKMFSRYADDSYRRDDGELSFYA